MKKINVLPFFLVVFVAPLMAQTNLSSTLCNQKLTMSGSPYIANKTVIVPTGCTLTVEPGVQIQMAYNSYFIIRGKADFIGTATKPITLRAKDPDTAWGILYFDSTGSQKSVLNYVNIEDATKGTHGTSYADSSFQQSAISGYYSSVELNHCIFKDNLLCIYSIYCDDFLIKSCTFDSSNVGEKIHLERTDAAVIDNCIFYFTSGDGDAIDIDGSENVIISNNRIFGGDADGIDIGNSDKKGCKNVMIRRNFIYHMGDKGISCCEESTITAEHNVIVGCSKGIGSKSNGVATFNHNTLYANRVCVAAYDKHDGWGAGTVNVSNCIIAGSDTTCFKDSVSFLKTTYTLSDKDSVPGIGNIHADPMFVFPSNDSLADFTLNSGSPAIDSGDPTFASDSDGTPTDMGAFYYPHVLAIPIINKIAFDIRIDPNPAKQYINITVPSMIFSGSASTDGNITLFISDISGRILGEKKINAYKSKVDISELSAGIYFIEMKAGEKLLFTEKLIIQQ